MSIHCVAGGENQKNSHLFEAWAISWERIFILSYAVDESMNMIVIMHTIKVQ